jgi:hypothetical protein
MHSDGENLDHLLPFLLEITGTPAGGRRHKRQLQARSHTTLSPNERNRQSLGKGVRLAVQVFH